MVLLNDILDHEKAFNEYIHFLSIEDHAGATETARSLIAGLRGTLEKIQRDYPRLLIDAHIPDYWEDEKKFRDGGTSFSAAELTTLAPRLEKYVSRVEREVRHFRLREPSLLLKLFVRYRRTVWIGASAVLGLILLLISARKFVASGHGLAGEYYGDTEMGVLYRKRIDPTVDFIWGRQSPFRKWRTNRFSVRWNGYLLVPETGRYDIYVHMDDGVRLYLDDQLIIDEWKARKLRVLKASLDLKYGYHPIRLDYFEKTKNATIRLFWKCADNPRPEPIPSRYLCPSERYRKSGVPVFGTQELLDADGEEPGSESEDDDANDSNEMAPQAPPPATKG